MHIACPRPPWTAVPLPASTAQALLLPPTWGPLPVSGRGGGGIYTSNDRCVNDLCNVAIILRFVCWGGGGTTDRISFWGLLYLQATHVKFRVGGEDLGPEASQAPVTAPLCP